MKPTNSLVTLACLMAGCGLFGPPARLEAQSKVVPNWQIDPAKELNPNCQWLREAKWGLFAHYLAHPASTRVPTEMSAQRWNQKVASFRIKALADQLTELRAPYFFITIGQGGGYYCSPNQTYERLFGPSGGKLTTRDLVAELAKELPARGIRLGVYLPAVGRRESAEVQQKWREVITEWSERWGEAISAWWIDGAVYPSPDTFKAFTAAFRAGSPKALVSYNVGPLGMEPDPKLPVTVHEDFLAGETNWHLPVSGVRPWDGKKYYMGPNISGDQLHYLTFLGSFWGLGEPRFPDELVVGWTKHTNNHGGTVSWDVPLSDEGLIPVTHFRQIKVLGDSIGGRK